MCCVGHASRIASKLMIMVMMEDEGGGGREQVKKRKGVGNDTEEKVGST